MGTLNSTPTGPEMPLKLWGGEQGQRLRRAQARHEMNKPARRLPAAAPIAFQRAKKNLSMAEAF